MTMTRKDGSFTIEECLAQLVRRGVLSVEDARARAMHREELEGLLTPGRP
jgi:Tfp pilus assembly pilus retraction ATPase PilT